MHFAITNVCRVQIIIRRLYMDINNKIGGGFTLPGETGYEDLTLHLADRWGADVIRDSDGTKLSDEILDSDFGIYSTICLIRSDNEWAKRNMDKLQQNFLMSKPIIAKDTVTTINPIDGYFTEQFIVTGEDYKEFWQVFDRTTGEEVDSSDWSYDTETGLVTINNTIPWHKYTVNFLATRIWEAISMYNHTTNDWGDKEHLMVTEPRYPETREQILGWLEEWCQDNPDTTVVRFTSLFYNFTWIWGEDERHRNQYTDWATYDFSVNPVSLREFETEYGYKMTSEDFMKGGKRNSTHNAPTDKYRDWMEFTHKFVVELGRECVDIVHKYGKKAYVFWDDSWVGLEPFSDIFKDLDFDGIIKCVFNGFETRMCAAVEDVETHEIRLHPYLFPTGLGGLPTFSEDGDPTRDAREYWINVRRALLRETVDRIGLGGYLHLVEDYPDFVDYIEYVADEFRTIKQLHQEDHPDTIPGKVIVLTSWGKLRTWTCSGHLHEQPQIDLTNILESLAGLPLDVEFMNFSDLLDNGIPEDAKVIINAGVEGSAWSGGDVWDNDKLITMITDWVANGGGFIGVNEPTSSKRPDSFFSLNHVLGVDRNTGDMDCVGTYDYELVKDHFITDDSFDLDLKKREGVYVLGKDTKVLVEKDNTPILTAHEFEEGKAVYMSSFKFSNENTRLLLRSILYVMGEEEQVKNYFSDNLHTECAYFADSKQLIAINNSDTKQITKIHLSDNESLEVELDAYETKFISH